MKVTTLEAQGLIQIDLEVKSDDRGFFIERYKRSEFRRHGLEIDLVQDNHSRSSPGVIRGLHFQYAPSQGKLVGVTRGRILDVSVDIRPDSKTFGKSCAVELSDVSGRLMWVPAGFAHGFCVLGDEPADVVYKVDAEYNPLAEGGIIWSDPDLAIQWPVATPDVSARDRELQTFAEYCANPVTFG